MMLFPAYALKSIRMSGRSAGATMRELFSGWTGLKDTLVGMFAGLGRKPPSVPICNTKALPPGLFGSHAAGALVGTPVAGLRVIPFGLASATYSCRFKKRALQAFSIRSR